MIKHVLTSLRALVQTIVLGVQAVQNSGVDASPLRVLPLESQGATLRLSGLPEYPTPGAVSAGECHRLEILSATLSTLLEDMERFRGLVRSAETVALGMAASVPEHRQRVSVSSVHHPMSKRLADLVVSDVLFDPSVLQQEVDGDLFESVGEECARMALPVFQMRHKQDRLDAELFVSYRSGG